ncbi:energy-coupling factor ABC transporter ATP-binding protein [Anaeromyxobacter oryzisoli]|uniref:energy-coupling factor ABC transporter ATP-binding protein n=1 Tax=Anaeromyxobacter oryzisoli TaxID=2925408 RepID=UPI001F5A09E2|nr:ABC transporter ATP-binding protein [Anaeromyxobacter sp. SG63]
MIRASEVTFAYPGGPSVLGPVSFEIAPGSLCGLVGANGSGKSTLLALLAGLFVPSTGTLTVNGRPSPGDVQGVRAAVALVLQDPDQQIVGATVGEDLLLGLTPRDPAQAERALALAARFGLGDPTAPVQTLSLGGRRKLCIATALRDAPEVLVLDEPFAGLDYPAGREMRALLASNRAAGRTQVIASHDVEPFADLADAWLVLEAGRVVLRGATDAVFRELRAHGVRPPTAWRPGEPVPAWE